MTPYRERLTAPPSWWIAALAFALVWGWVMLVVTTWPIAIVTFVLVGVAGAYAVWRFGSLTITVDAASVRVGRAHVDASHVGGATALNRADYRARLGVGADARAYLVTRPYLDHGVEIVIDDASDPTPYWLVSSRRPDALAAAINPPADAPDATVHETIGDVRGGEEA